MNIIKRFFQEDIPAVFSAGKWRVNLMQLNARLSQFDKQKNAAITELGNKAWEGRVKDDNYSGVYSKLEELDMILAQTQKEIDSKQDQINQETEHLNSTNLEFNTRLQSIQNQRQSALQKLAQLQASQKSIETRINQLQTAVNQGVTNEQNMQSQLRQLQESTLPDKEEKTNSLQNTLNTIQMQINESKSQIDMAKVDFEANLSEQTPVKSEVDGQNQLISMLQEKNRSAVAAIQENLKLQRQDLIKATEKKNDVMKQMNTLMPDLGSQVYRFRPVSAALSSAYAKIDAVQNEIKEVNDQVNLTQARLASVNTKSVQKVTIVGLLLVILVACVGVLATVVIPKVSQMLKPDPKRDIRLVESWTLENCSAYGSSENYLDISVWENRRKDAIASAEIGLKLLGTDDVVLDSTSSELEVAPGGWAVSVQGMDSKGSRVQEITRLVNSAYFTETTITQLRDVDVKTFFEKTRDTNNVTLSLEITNGSDFALEPNEIAYALVANSQNKIIDILVGNLNFNTIAVDSLTTMTFQSLNYYGSVSCFQSDYSQETVTFWYFVPVQTATNTNDRFTISGKVDYSP